MNTGVKDGRLQDGQIKRRLQPGRLNGRIHPYRSRYKLVPLLTPFRHWLNKNLRRPAEKELGSVAAYDLWAEAYDEQPGNLMLDLDQRLFAGLLHRVPVTGKRVADIGCGTGRHWPAIMAEKPGSLTGFDVSPGMLARLHKKFQGAETVLIGDTAFPDIPDCSFDVLVSTLTLAHIADAAAAVKTWCRMLSPGGHLLMTDFHPDVLASGGKRTFVHGKNLISVRNYVFPVEELETELAALGMELVNKTEQTIDASLHHYYVAKNAEHVYDRYLNARIIYGLHYVKSADSWQLADGRK